MTFIELKKRLIDIEMSLPKFCDLIKVSDKNIQSYKKKDEVPNAIAVAVTCCAKLHEHNIDFKSIISDLHLIKKTKKGCFAKKQKDEPDSPEDDSIFCKDDPFIFFFLVISYQSLTSVSIR